MSNTPQIRFDGFTGDWKECLIADTITEISRPIIMDDEKCYQLVTVKRRNEGIVSRGFFKGGDILVKNYFEIHAGDYLISKRQLIHGANGLVPDFLDNAIVSNEYYTCISNEKITTEYLALLSKTQKMYRMFFLSSYGVDVEKMVFNIEDWKKRTFQIPQIEEQKKMGTLFTKLDTLITLHQRKCDALQKFKKSMLQKMFPQNGENVPEIRFAGFTEDWEQRKFSDLATIRRGLTYKPDNIIDGGKRVLRSSNINEDTFETHDDDVFVDENAVNIPYVHNGDILITSANGSSRLVGKHAIIRDIPDNSAVHGGFMLLASSDEPEFVNALMSSPWYTKFISVYVAGGNGAIGNLNKNDLDEQVVYVPQIDEMQKIGVFFSNLDTLITLHQRKLETLQKMKKALLQKMFV